ncbi:MAG: hypothetical protein JNL89_02555 [Rhodanobacteraceae bacterium]|nr:hypothetical protein [Rhodanobacteraceae bacterium]
MLVLVSGVGVGFWCWLKRCAARSSKPASIQHQQPTPTPLSGVWVEALRGQIQQARFDPTPTTNTNTAFRGVAGALIDRNSQTRFKPIPTTNTNTML